MLAKLLKSIFVKDNKSEESKNIAKSRLQFVLVQDRAGLSNEELNKFKIEMMQVIERYFVIDKSLFDISYERKAETTTMLINSPVFVKRQSIEEPKSVSDLENSETQNNLSQNDLSQKDLSLIDQIEMEKIVQTSFEINSGTTETDISNNDSTTVAIKNISGENIVKSSLKKDDNVELTQTNTISANLENIPKN